MDQLPPTTAAPTTSVDSEIELPRTGSDTNRSLVLIGSVLMLLGGIMMLGTRRPLGADNID